MADFQTSNTVQALMKDHPKREANPLFRTLLFVNPSLHISIKKKLTPDDGLKPLLRPHLTDELGWNKKVRLRCIVAPADVAANLNVESFWRRKRSVGYGFSLSLPSGISAPIIIS